MHLFNMVLLKCIWLGYNVNTAISIAITVNLIQLVTFDKADQSNIPGYGYTN